MRFDRHGLKAILPGLAGFSNPIKCLLKDSGLIDDVLYTVVRKGTSAFPEYVKWW